MANEDSVRPSRTGDQFHYYWAARRCLGLLPPNSDLVAISIEGPAVSDGARNDAGVESIDVAEYRGSTDPKTATQIRYVQLKHSSRRVSQPWVASDLADTFRNFSSRYLKFVEAFGAYDVSKRFSFEFVTNRPIAASLADGFEQLRSGEIGARGRAAAKAFGLDEEDAVGFAEILTLTGNAKDFLEQRSLLHDDVSGYLPEADRDAPLQMKHMVERRATTEFENRPEITKLDVLKALGTSLEDLYPAPPLIDLPKAIVHRDQLQDLAIRIIEGKPLTIIRADAGVGKSVLSTQLGSLMPSPSETFVYDCFGGGAYRSASGYRHRCRDGLVQLSNEMAGRSLSDPLIPTPKADPAAYMRAFKARVERAASVIGGRSPEALLCIVIDAADNAQMAADEVHDGPSFARLALREAWPANVRIVLTARPQRVHYLDPPQSIAKLNLQDFDEAESGQHLRSVFSEASETDVREFHRQTSKNPRVQATALSQPGSLADMLRGLAGKPRTVDVLIGELLENAVDRITSEIPEAERAQIDRVCAALATLRPFVPLDIVARVADVPVAMVRSMAHDLQRPLIVREDAIQFRDEPTETWFRDRYRPSGERLDEFIARLLPIAATSAYVAAGLPQLLLEAKRFDDLVRLALSDEALPEEPAMARRDVALQRLRFALKAAIRDHRYPDAAKLALKAGGEAAADARQQKLISANSDIAAHFLEPDQMLEQVSRRLIAGGEWTGSDHAYEAAFLSGVRELAGDAGSRLRLAYDWLWHWARNPGDERRGRKSVKPEDVAEMALAELNLNGAEQCCRFLRRWRKREMSYRAGRLLVSRLVDVGRFDDIETLADAAGNDLGLLLALTSELARVGRYPAEPVVRRMTRLVTSRHVRIEEPSGSFGNDIVLLGAVTDAVAAALWHRTAPRRLLARTLTRYMPERPPSLEGHSANYKNGRSIYLSAFCLRAALRNETVTSERLKPLEMRPSKSKAGKFRRSSKSRRRYTADSGEIIRFEEEIAVLLPWHLLVADIRVGRVPTAVLGTKMTAAAEASVAARKRIYDENRSTSDEVAMLWGGVLLGAADPGPLIAPFEEWRQSLPRSLYAPALLSLSRRAGRTEGCARLCLDLGQAAFSLMADEREDAQGIAELFVDVSRAVLQTSMDEAREYFEQAIEVSGKIGEENLHRWRALSDLAKAAGGDRSDRPELAYRYSRVAELVYAYSDNFDWDYTIKSLVHLSPPSGPTIISRWIDRRFARRYDALPKMVSALRQCEAIDPRDALSMLAFSSLSSREDLLKEALRSAGSRDERERIVSHFVRFTRRLRYDADDWRKIAAILAAEGVTSSDVELLVAKPDEKADDKDTPAPRPKRPAASSYVPPTKERDWNAIFRDLVLTDAADIAEAHARFRSGDPPWSTDVFYREAMSRVPAGKESAFIAATDAAAIASLYGARELLGVLPETWKKSLAVRRALLRFVKALAAKECTSIITDQSYPVLPWDELAALGLSRDEVFREAVKAMGETTLPVNHGDLFDLAGLLSTMISPGEAADALSFGLGLMEPLLLEGDDGAWRGELAPPASVPDAIAGFVWASLASPWAERRWEAAHVVRSMCALDRSELVKALIELAHANKGLPYAAPELPFYAMHAQLWLLIALARVSDEHPAVAARFLPLIDAAARRANAHVLMRDFAATALLALGRHGEVQLDAERRADLDQINTSLLAGAPKRKKAARRGSKWKAKAGYLFGYDFGQYWAAPLGGPFQLGEDDIHKAASAVIQDNWGSEETGSYQRDARIIRRQFDQERDYRLSSAWPKVDDLSFYHSVHSIMMTAGHLLDSAPVVEREDAADLFAEWLDRYRLSLRSGLWLADRRDDKPAQLWLATPAKGKSGYPDLRIADLLHTPDGDIVTSADWEVHRDHIRQSIDIRSTLVSADRSGDLARALQSAMDHDDYRLPTVEDEEDEIDTDAWYLRGWLRSDDRERRLDRHDPWASGLYSRIPGPGGRTCALLGLTTDAAERRWSHSNGPATFRSEVWSDGEEYEDVLHDRGKRLLATRDALDSLMERTGKHMLFELGFEVDRVETRHTSYMKKEKFDAVKLTRYFILRPGQDFEAAPRIDRTGRRARRATRSEAIE